MDLLACPIDHKLTCDRYSSDIACDMTSFIKFLDLKGFLIALTSLDGVITYMTQASKTTFQFNPHDIVGQNISLLLKDPQLLDGFRSTCASLISSASPSYWHTVKLETIHNTSITAHFSPPNSSLTAQERYSRSLSFRSPSSLAQAIQCRSFKVIDNNHFNSDGEDEEEMSFNECFEF